MAAGKTCVIRTQCGKGDVVQVGISALKEEVLTALMDLLEAPRHVQGNNRFVQASLHANEERAVIIAIERDEAVVEIRKAEVERVDLDRDKMIQGYFRR